MIVNRDRGGARALPPDAQARIGSKLREMYDSVVREPVPDRFANLLDQLQASSKSSDTADPENEPTEHPPSAQQNP